MMLHLLSPEALIIKMQSQNIKFEKTTVNDAIKYLTYNTYYKKISSYKKNFSYSTSEKEKRYFDLDFEYLKDLSIIDMRLRMIIIESCLNIEHSVKIKIINTCQAQGLNGYDIVTNFLNKYPKIEKSISINSTNGYCKNLVGKHTPNLPIWVLLEVISFGDLCKLYQYLVSLDYFGDHTKSKVKDNTNILFSIHNLRNAAAHSQCILRDLTYNNELSPSHLITNYVSKVTEISDSKRQNALKTPFYYEFTCILYGITNYINSEGIRKHLAEELYKEFYARMPLNKDYYKNCAPVKNANNFFKKILDFYLFYDILISRF